MCFTIKVSLYFLREFYIYMMNFRNVMLISLFVLYRLLSAMGASRRIKEEDASKNGNEWFDVYNRDGLYNYEDCNAQLDMRDLDKDFDWHTLSSNVVEVGQRSDLPLALRKSMKKKKKSPEQGHKSNSLKERRLPFQYAKDVEPMKGKFKKSNQKKM